MSDRVTIKSGLLTGPMVKVRDGRIVSMSNLVFSTLTLFLFIRSVTVDPAIQIIRIQRRIFWLFSASREIPLSTVRRIDYEYSKKFKDASLFDMLISILIFLSFKSRYYYLDSDEKDSSWGRYVVSVLLQDSSMVKLWSFSGRDDAGSLYCTEYLQHLTGLPLV